MNKANLKKIPVDTYRVSTGDIVDYLKKEVFGSGVNFQCDFTRWTGDTIDHSYVRMRVVFPKDALTVPGSVSSSPTIDKILNDYGISDKINKTIIDAMTPFMYPQNINRNDFDNDNIQRMASYGIWGNNLDEIIRFSHLTLMKDVPSINQMSRQDYFAIYLRPERIIKDMLTDVTTGDAGNMTITSVQGTTSETIRWTVEVSEKDQIDSAVSIDAVFDSRK